MVHGLDKFKEYLGEYTNQYVFIGGTACDILMDEIGAPFRATKDLDIVLIIEALDQSFAKEFWRFIEDGGYRNRKKSMGKEQFYRFDKPIDKSFPLMIELFSRRPFDLKFQTGFTPIHINESIISLSAILLDDAYYDLLLSSRKLIEGYPVITIESIILFKIKAWIDLKKDNLEDSKFDSKDIIKHKNDVFRLLANVLPSSKIAIEETIKDDIHIFLEMIYEDKPNLLDLGIRETSFDDMINLLKSIFL